MRPAGKKPNSSTKPISCSSKPTEIERKDKHASSLTPTSPDVFLSPSQISQTSRRSRPLRFTRDGRTRLPLVAAAAAARDGARQILDRADLRSWRAHATGGGWVVVRIAWIGYRGRMIDDGSVREAEARTGSGLFPCVMLSRQRERGKRWARASVKRWGVLHHVPADTVQSMRRRGTR